ncbi:MAG: hypothetical protein HQ530_00720 [Parcubacteria group bacterium]|nr:hypothetical protein [Parcubacteria group bacterium]
MGFLSNLFGGLGGGGDYWSNFFGLEEGEKVIKGSGGFFDPDVSGGETIAAGIAGLLTGGQVTVGGKSVVFAITDKGRFYAKPQGGKEDPIVLGPDNKPQVEETDRDGGRLGAEKSKSVKFTMTDGEVFRIFMPLSAIPDVINWSQGK